MPRAAGRSSGVRHTEAVAGHPDANNDRHPERVADQTLPAGTADEWAAPGPTDAGSDGIVPFGARGARRIGRANVGRPAPVAGTMPIPGKPVADFRQVRHRRGDD